MESRSTRRFAVLLFIALALIAAACGGGESESDDDDDGATTTAAPASTEAATDEAEDETDDDDDGDETDDDAQSTETAEEAPADEAVDCSEATASDVGVTEDTIKVGLISVDLEPLFGTGFVNENTPDNFFSRSMSLIHAVNEAGGINCRQIELVQETYDPARSAETQVPACERLAQDQEVFVAIAAFPDSAGGGIDCMWERFGIPFATSGPVPQDTIDAAGGLVVAGRPNVEIMAATAAKVYEDIGAFEGEKVAVWGGDSGELGIARTTLVEDLTEAGVDVVDVELPSSGGTTAVWGVAPQVVASMIEQDVTTVVMLGSSVTVEPFYQEMKASGADWKWLVVDVQGSGGLFAPQKMPDDWKATALTTQLHEDRTSDADVECIEAYELMRESGLWDESYFEVPEPSKGNTNTTRPLSNDCALAKLIIVGLENAGVNPTRDSFVEGLNNAGEVEIAFETDGVLEPGKGYVSDTVHLFTQYGPNAQECIDLGYFPEIGCWGPYDGDDPGALPNVVPE